MWRQREGEMGRELKIWMQGERDIDRDRESDREIISDLYQE